jgi:hypothetical protein
MHRRRTGQTHPLLTPHPDDEYREDEDPLTPGIASDSNIRGIPEDQGTLASGKDGSTRLFGSVGGALVHVMAVCFSMFFSVFQCRKPNYL